MSDANERLAALEAHLAARERDVARREQEVERLKEQLAAEGKDLSSNGKKAFKSELPLEEMFPALPRPRPIHSREIEIGPSIGTGKFADVCMGFLRVPCAVKKMRGPTSAENLAGFRREATIMNACNHPNVIKLLGYCSEAGKYYLVQELVTGGNLHERMHKKHCHLTYQQVVRVGLQVAEAMVHLHGLNIVHRDIKPHNFVIDNSFEPAKVLLCDFGLARMKTGQYVETDGRIAGTPAYQAPEMLRLQPITEKVDQYSFAILLWEMITCQLPWWGKTFEEMVNCVTRLDERPAIPADCPEPLASIVRECWQPDPSLRPSFDVVRQRMRAVNDMLRAMPEFRSKVGPQKSSGNNNGMNGATNKLPANITSTSAMGHRSTAAVVGANFTPQYQQTQFVSGASAAIGGGNQGFATLPTTTTGQILGGNAPGMYDLQEYANAGAVNYAQPAPTARNYAVTTQQGAPQGGPGGGAVYYL